MGENCQGFLTHHHNCYCDDITIANFILHFISSQCLCIHTHTPGFICVSRNMWQRQKPAHSACNSVCGGTNTHLYDNFLFTSAVDSNTDTIHFPFINWCRNVVFRGSDFWSLLGLKGDGVCFPGGEPLVADRGSSACEAAWSALWPLHETLGSKPVSSNNTFAISGIITSTGHLVSPAANSPHHILLSESLFYFNGRHPESTLRKHTDTELTTRLLL